MRTMVKQVLAILLVVQVFWADASGMRSQAKREASRLPMYGNPVFRPEPPCTDMWTHERRPVGRGERQGCAP